MASLIFPPFFKIPHKPISIINPPHIFPIYFEYPLSFNGKKPQKNRLFGGFSRVFRVVGMCKKWENDGDSELERKVLEFMRKSKNPEMFPSKNELVNAGRMDLVEGIMRSSGWMSMGWDDSEVKLDDGVGFRVEKYGGNCEEMGVDKEVDEGSGNSPSSVVSPFCQSIELEKEVDTGIEGILHRLEKQRNLDFGVKLRNNGNMDHGFNEKNDESSKDVDSCHPERSVPVPLGHDEPMYSGNGSVKSYSNTLNGSPKADTWRAWSVQRSGYSDKEFEAAEIDFGGRADREIPDIKRDFDITKDLESLDKEFSQSDVKSRLQILELELSSALHSLSSDTTDLSEMAEEHSPEDFSQLSDASEFQENDILHSQNKLRSMRAKLAVLEGKMALAIIDAQKILEEKQKRIDGARAVLQLLRTTCIVWSGSGSEVRLAGSFDGWATQRKMERSSSGSFSLCLKLYPGQYEIKFIVDGAWMIDPLRPIVNNNGYENNLLIIS